MLYNQDEGREDRKRNLRIGRASRMKKGLILAVVCFLLFPAICHAAIMADIVFVLDISNSMRNDIKRIKARIIQFNSAMLDNDIDAQYALVTFGYKEKFQMDLGTFAQFNAKLKKIKLTMRNPERGSAATELAISDITFRVDSNKNFILITDEGDYSTLASFQAVGTGLTALDDAYFNAVCNPKDYNTLDRYAVLADEHGGQIFNIKDFRKNPDPFFTNFVNTKVKEIKGGPTNPAEPATLCMLALGGLALLRKKAGHRS